MGCYGPRRYRIFALPLLPPSPFCYPSFSSPSHPFPSLQIPNSPQRRKLLYREANLPKRSPFRAPAWAKPMGQTHLEFVYVCMCALCARLEPLGAALASSLSTVPSSHGSQVPIPRSSSTRVSAARSGREREANRRRRRRGSPPLHERRQSVTEYANAPFPTATVHV